LHALGPGPRAKDTGEPFPMLAVTASKPQGGIVQRILDPPRQDWAKMTGSCLIQ